MNDAVAETMPEQSDAPVDPTGFGGFFERVEQSSLDEQYDQPDQAATETQDDQAGKETQGSVEPADSDGDQTQANNDQTEETKTENDPEPAKVVDVVDPRDAEIARLKAENEAAVRRMHEATREAKEAREKAEKPEPKRADEPSADDQSRRNLHQSTLERIGKEIQDAQDAGDLARYAELQVQLMDARVAKQLKPKDDEIKALREEQARLISDFRRINGDQIEVQNAATTLNELVEIGVLPDDHGLDPAEYLGVVKSVNAALQAEGKQITADRISGEAAKLWRSKMTASAKPTQSQESTPKPAQPVARKPAAAPSSARATPPARTQPTAMDESFARMSRHAESMRADQYD